MIDIDYSLLVEEVRKHFDLNEKTRKRFQHTLGVVKMSLKINDKLGLNLDIKELQLAALFHDYMKIDSEEEQLKKYQAYEKDLALVKSMNPSIVHAFLAPYVLKEKYPFLNEAILNAIRYHTTGRANMSLLEKVIYVADAVEDGRGYADLAYYQNLACTSIDQAVAAILKYTIDDLHKKHQPIHQYTIDAYNDIIKNKEK